MHDGAICSLLRPAYCMCGVSAESSGWSMTLSMEYVVAGSVRHVRDSSHSTVGIDSSCIVGDVEVEPHRIPSFF
jgi:hypothetical protein